MTQPKEPETKLIPRTKAAAMVGVSVRTFRRKYEREFPPASIDERGKALFDPRVIEEIVHEERPPLTSDQLALENIRSSGAIAAESLEIAVDAMSKLDERSSKLFDALIKENARLTKDNESLVLAMAAMRDEHRVYLDAQAERERADKTADLELARRTELQKHGLSALKYLAPAAAALLARKMGADAGPATRDAISALAEKLSDDKRQRLMAAVASSGALEPEEMLAVGLLFQDAGKSAVAPKPGAAKPGAGSPEEMVARLGELTSEMEALNARLEAAASKKENPS